VLRGLTLALLLSLSTTPRVEPFSASMVLRWEPFVATLEKPPSLVAKVQGGDWLCVGYELLEVGDRNPYERPRFYIPIMRLSCRGVDPEEPVERFYFNRVIDGTYKVFGWLQQGGKSGPVVARPFDQIMVVR